MWRNRIQSDNVTEVQKYFFCRYEMDYKDIFILAVSVALCLIAVEEVSCQNKNMCLKSVCTCCTCNYNDPMSGYVRQVSCSDLTEIPKDIPKEVHVM